MQIKHQSKAVKNLKYIVKENQSDGKKESSNLMTKPHKYEIMFENGMQLFPFKSF